MSILKSPTAAVIRNAQIDEAPAHEVDYEMLHPAQMFGSHVNLIPLQSSVAAPRQFYGARFFNQAVPLVHREVPLVQNRNPDDPDGKSFDDAYGESAGARYATEDGTVTKLENGIVHYKDAAGDKKQIALYHSYPFNRATRVHNTPTVKVGDVFKKGAIVAGSNFTDDKGTLAMGANARVGLVPYKGWTIDDAIAFSESFAKKMRSEQAYTHEQEFDDTTKGGLHHFKSLFPTAFTKDQLGNMDEHGVVKVGTILKHGDPIVLASTPKTVTSSDAKVGKLSRVLQTSRRNASQTWDHEDDGEVLDVVHGRKGVKVVTKSESPTKVGDKLCFRSGAKAILSNIIPDDKMVRTKDGRPLEVLLNPLSIGCYDSETEILTTEGWIKAPEISMNHVFATLNTKSFMMEFQQPSAVIHAPYEGKMYKLVNSQLDMLVTPNHRMFSAPREKPEIYGSVDLKDSFVRSLFEIKEAREVSDQPRKYVKAARWHDKKGPKYYEVAAGTKSRTGKTKEGFRVRADHWAEFMGWFITEGYTNNYLTKKKGRVYVVGISQSITANPKKHARIDALLTAMDVKYWKGPNTFLIFHKGLYERLAVLGKARQKYIPREILDMPVRQLKIFLDAAIAGDGCTTNNAETGHVNCRVFTTYSPRLAGDMQELTAKLGISINIRKRKDLGEQSGYVMSLKKNSPTTWTNWSQKTKRRQIEEWVDYSGMVHCATVPNGILFVRRNGRAVFSGNSRVNNGLPYELLYGKIAEKRGEPMKVDGFTEDGTSRLEDIKKQLTEHGLTDKEDLFDPETNKMLDNPVTVGNGYMLKLIHMGEHKGSSRGVGGVDANFQPMRGSGDSAKAKRLSGLEIGSMLSSGAYANLREASTVRGTANDEFWRALRSGHTSPTPGRPFVFNKFLAMLQGAGLKARDMGSGKLRLGPLTDSGIEGMSPAEIKHGETVDMSTLEPIAGGLFDQALTGNNRWGKITLPHAMPNPAMEDSIRVLLGLTKKDFDAVMAGRMELNAGRK